MEFDVTQMTQFDEIWAHGDASMENIEGEVISMFPNIDFQPDPYRHSDGRLTGLKNGFISVVVPLGVDRSRMDLIVYSNVEHADPSGTRRPARELRRHAGAVGAHHGR